MLFRCFLFISSGFRIFGWLGRLSHCSICFWCFSIYFHGQVVFSMSFPAYSVFSILSTDRYSFSCTCLFFLMIFHWFAWFFLSIPCVFHYSLWFSNYCARFPFCFSLFPRVILIIPCVFANYSLCFFELFPVFFKLFLVFLLTIPCVFRIIPCAFQTIPCVFWILPCVFLIFLVFF